MRHLYHCSSDQLSQNLKIWLRDATKKCILNTHMELDCSQFHKFKVIAVKLIIQKTTQTHIDRKSRANALLIKTLKVLKYSYTNHGDQRVFSIWNHHKCLSCLFSIHLNTYVMRLRPLEIFLLLQCRGSMLDLRNVCSRFQSKKY